MIKSQLIANLASKLTHMTEKQVTNATNTILEIMSQTLIDDSRIEIRGFGSFSVRHRPGRQTRNPKTGATVYSEARKRPHFKPGKELRDRVNQSRERFKLADDD